jgi:5-methylcytosine-specific restriction endonuclease McrA
MGNNKGKPWTKEQAKEYKRNWHYQKAFNGMRDLVLERDNWSCVKCGMTNEQHIIIFGRAITIDHKNKDRNNNTLENLQTLCLKCHTRKDNQDNIIRKGEHRSPRTEFKKGSRAHQGYFKKKQKAEDEK